VKELPIVGKELRRRADGLSFVRAGLVVLVVVAARVLQPVAEETGFFYALRPLPFYLVLAGVLALTFLFRLGHRKVRSLEKLLYMEVCFDVALTTYIVRWTGGVDSVFVIVYVVSILSTSLLLSAAGGFGIASLATLMFTAAALSDQVLAHWASPEMLRWLTAVSFFYLTAFLAGFLSSGAERVRVFSASLLENLVSGAAILDVEGRVVYLNPAARSILALAGREKGLTDRALFGTTSGDDLVLRSLQQGVSRQREEIEVARANGTPVPIGITVSLLQGRKGRLRGAVVSFVDLTEVRKLEAEVRLRDRMASLGTMSAGLAHELRNPLASVSSSAELLGRSTGLEGDERRLLRVIQREAARLDQIVTAFLEYCQQRPLSQDEVNLERLLRQVVASAKDFPDWAENHRADLQFSDYRSAVRGDSVQLRQCFLNVVRNATQAMPAGGTLRIAVHPAEDGRVEVDFSDEGGGMTDEQLRHIFDPFYSTREDGIGLGLSVVHRIVEAHRGSIRVHSQPGHGATFHVSLPVAQPMTKDE
jgi:two-component system sensor histidine kinase PilS (NtrC family)